MRYSGQKILVPYNFSKESDYALELAIDLADSLGTSITLLHVAELSSYAGFDDDLHQTYSTELNRFLVEKMDKKIEKLVPDDLSVVKTVATGKSPQAIVDLTKKGEFGLVIMGYQKSPFPDKNVSGSTVERVIRFANIPILTIRAPIASDQIRDIVFASELTATPTFVVTQLAKIQHALKAKLHVVRINTRQNWIPSSEAQSQMDYFRKVHHMANYDFDTYDDLTPELGILNYANNINAGMIAIGVHNLTRIDSLVHHHHIAEDVLKRTNQLLWTCTL